MESMTLNRAQIEALHAFFDPMSLEGEPFDYDAGLKVDIAHGQIAFGEMWLHTDGEWATFMQPMGSVPR